MPKDWILSTTPQNSLLFSCEIFDVQNALESNSTVLPLLAMVYVRFDMVHAPHGEQKQTGGAFCSKLGSRVARGRSPRRTC